MIKLIIFIIGTVFFILVSLRNFRTPISHGFFRFFAFELVLVAILLNIDVWFKNPFSPAQIISWLLFIISIAMVILGYNLLLKIGKPVDNNFEHTSVLVTEGIYRFIRHPMYSSLFFMSWGIFFKQFTLVNLIVLLLTLLFIYLTARIEEKENLQRFGEEYKAFMQKTKMFVPFIF